MAISTSEIIPSDALIDTPLIRVYQCGGLNIEITGMILIGGFPPIHLDDCVSKCSAKIYKNQIIKNDILVSASEGSSSSS